MILLILVVALPIIIFVRLYMLNRSGELFGVAEIKFVYGIWHSIYKPKVYTWESFVVVRRLVLATVTFAPQFNTDQSQRFTYLNLCCVAFLSVHLLFVPFRLPIDNYAEATGEFTLVVLTLFLASAPTPLPETYAGGLSAMCFAVGLVFAIRVIVNRWERAKRLVGQITDFMATHCPRGCVKWCQRHVTQRERHRSTRFSSAAAGANGTASTRSSGADIEGDREYSVSVSVAAAPRLPKPVTASPTAHAASGNGESKQNGGGAAAAAAGVELPSVGNASPPVASGVSASPPPPAEAPSLAGDAGENGMEHTPPPPPVPAEDGDAEHPHPAVPANNA